jgi:valyl-tRNA synthetase
MKTGDKFLVRRKSTEYRESVELFELEQVTEKCYKFILNDYSEGYVKWFIKEEFEETYNIIETL